MHGSALATPTDEAPPGTPDTADRRHRRWWLPLILAGLAAFVLVSLLPWEWSFIDDGQLIGDLHAAQAQYGAVEGVCVTVYRAYLFDVTSWGLFRPAYWVWQAVFYLLPVGPAHAVRVVMLGCAVAGPVLALRRRWTGALRRAAMVWCAAAVLVDGSLWSGLWYPSLQELDGLAFVGLGLAAGRRRPVLRLACFVVAAWFKAPFGWLLLAYGLLLIIIERRWRYGAPATLLGAGTLLAATIMARGGSYTSALVFGPDHLLSSAMGLAYACGPAGLVVLTGAIGLSGRPGARSGPAADALPAALVLGGLGYAGNLLPWHVGGYYPAPVVYLLTVGAVLLWADRVGRSPAGMPSGARPWVGVAVTVAATVLVTAGLLASPVRGGVDTMADVAGLRDCVLRLPADAVVGFNGGEGDLRLAQIVRMRRASWHGEIGWVDLARPSPRLEYYVQPRGTAAPARLLGPAVCATPSYLVRAVRR